VSAWEAQGSLSGPLSFSEAVLYSVFLIFTETTSFFYSLSLNQGHRVTKVTNTYFFMTAVYQKASMSYTNRVGETTTTSGYTQWLINIPPPLGLQAPKRVLFNILFQLLGSIILYVMYLHMFFFFIHKLSYTQKKKTKCS